MHHGSGRRSGEPRPGRSRLRRRRSRRPTDHHRSPPHRCPREPQRLPLRRRQPQPLPAKSFASFSTHGPPGSPWTPLSTSTRTLVSAFAPRRWSVPTTFMCTAGPFGLSTSAAKSPRISADGTIEELLDMAEATVRDGKRVELAFLPNGVPTLLRARPGRARGRRRIFPPDHRVPGSIAVPAEPRGSARAAGLQTAPIRIGSPIAGSASAMSR